MYKLCDRNISVRSREFLINSSDHVFNVLVMVVYHNHIIGFDAGTTFPSVGDIYRRDPIWGEISVTKPSHCPFFVHSTPRWITLLTSPRAPSRLHVVLRAVGEDVDQAATLPADLVPATIAL